MRRFKDLGGSGSDEDSDSGDHDHALNFKRNKRSRLSDGGTSEVDGKLKSSAGEKRNGIGVIKYAPSSATSPDDRGSNGECASRWSGSDQNGNTKVVVGSKPKLVMREDVNSPLIKQLGISSGESIIIRSREGDSSTHEDKVKRNPPLTITDRSSSSEIMRTMGFDRSKGLGQLINDREVSSNKLEQIQRILAEVGITVEDDSVDLQEEIHVEEEIKWIPPVLPEHAFTYPGLRDWKKIGPKKESIQGETEFIDPAVLKKLLALKQCFNVLNYNEYLQIRSRCNPFEKTGKGPFVSRAGLKIASIDAALSFALTQPTTNSSDKQSFVGPNELFYFADVCAGPGGFSEYILFKKRWYAKGFGMTLKGSLDFQTLSFCPESFEPFYGPGKDGNVYNPENVIAFTDFIHKSTETHGVHLMMADGGFDVDEKEMQEPLSAQILVSQCLLALFLVRPGGMFVCKLFDTLTPFTVGLIYLMYQSFELVAIHKPNTSRPANSERYLICKWKKPETEGIARYLGDIHEIFWKWTCSGQMETGKEGINQIVPLQILKESKQFYEYIVESNMRIAKFQIENLKKMVVFCRNPTLEDPRQESVKKRCFEYWKVPEKNPNNIIKLSSPVQCETPDLTFKRLLKDQPADFLESSEFSLLEHNLETYIRSPFDWRIVVIEAMPGENNRGFYISLGFTRVYRFNGKGWTITTEKLELCKDTLVFGEFVDEIHGKKPNQRVIRTFHIIDAMVLGGVDVRGLHYTSRHEVCVKFAKSMNRPTKSELCPIRAKIPVRMENIGDIFDRLENRIVLSSGPHAQLVCPVDHTDEALPFIKPIGILFLKITKDPWTMALSRSANRKYYFNSKTGQSSYEIIPESLSEFMYTMQHRFVWWWDKELKNIFSTQDVTDLSRPIKLNAQNQTLHPHSLLNYVGGAWLANKNMVMRRLSSSSNSHGSS